MVNSVIGGFQKISKKREKSREEMDLAHARKYKKPKRIDKTGINTVIIDDWRRLLELRTLVEEDKFNCITVYLDKDGIEVYEGTAATESFEGQISKEDCSLFFKFNNDWSNSNEIVNILKETVTG